MATETKTQAHLKEEANLPTYSPMPWSISEVREAIPNKYYERHTWTSMRYLFQDIAMATAIGVAGSYIDSYFTSDAAKALPLIGGSKLSLEVARWAAWGAYWWFQGLVFTGIWVLGHDCGHQAFSPNKYINDAVGFITHSFLWTPYFSWRISHHRHHMNHNSMERDEVYVPKLRSDLGIPKAAREEIHWAEYFGDTPMYTLFMLIRQQFLAFPAYLLINVSGQKHYPWPTSHFDPTAILFTKDQRPFVILSNIGLITMGWLVKRSCDIWGGAMVFKMYGIPWLLVTHWFIMITYLHHTDPIIPHYRGDAWSYARGAASTVDRDFLGWQGYFFLHGVAHFHVIHHFFPKMPHYHGEEATQYLKKFLGEHYHYSDAPVFQTLWYNYNFCQFVEDEGDVLFYRDKEGRALVKPAEQPKASSTSVEVN